MSSAESLLFFLCARARPALTPTVLADVLAHLQESGAAFDRPQWLEHGVACRIICSGIVNQALLHSRLQGLPVDAVVLPPAVATPKKLLLADMDSTIITTESLDELAAAVGMQEKVAAITARAMNGELDFRAALAERVAMLEGLPVENITEAVGSMTYSDGAATLVATMKAKGAACVLVSGGFVPFTGRVRQQLGFDDDVANVFEEKDGQLTGRVVEPVHDKDSKKRTLQQWQEKLGIEVAETLTVGDGANDLPMLQAAGLGVAYHAKPVVREQAPVVIQHADLTALLFLQGYRAEDFVDAV